MENKIKTERSFLHNSLISLISILYVVGFGVALIACSSSVNESEFREKNERKTNGTLILATTSSTQDSGLLDVLIPLFQDQTGFTVKTIAVGSGQALAMGEKGEADVLLVHAPEAEQQLVDNGDVINRQLVMYNDFIVIGPQNDPARIQGLTLTEAFATIAEALEMSEENSASKKNKDDNEGKSLPRFVSRGDDSGTHLKEQTIWESINVQPERLSGYIETGQGMGATLNIAAERQAYTLSDRGTYLAFRHQLKGMTVLVEGDEKLQNMYHVMQVNPTKSSAINQEAAEAFVAFMVSDDVQTIIDSYGIDTYGEPLFFPFIEQSLESD